MAEAVAVVEVEQQSSGTAGWLIAEGGLVIAAAEVFPTAEVFPAAGGF